MAQFNLETFFTSAKKFRGGKFVWWKDANHEDRNNVLGGATIANPYNGFGYAFAADLFEYHIDKPGFLLKTFKVAAATDTTIKVTGDGYSHVPEVGNVLMKAPDTVDATGQSAKVIAVEFLDEEQVFSLLLDTAIGALTTDDILVEAADANGDPATTAAADATVLVKNANTFVEVDTPMMPTNGQWGIENVQHNINTVYGKRAFIARMQPLPKYILAKNRSYIDGIFEI
jgi:hypothetical protein